EIYPADNYGKNRNYTLSFTLKTNNDSVYTFRTRFKTASTNSFGNLKGSIRKDSIYSSNSVIITLLPSDSLNIGNTFKSLPVRDTVFQMEKILDGEYHIFAFIDLNDNGVYDYGSVYPFQASEPFYYYPSVIHIKG